MQPLVQAQLLQRVLQHISKGTTDLGAQPAPFSRHIYATPERLARETELLFRKFPLVVGFSGQLPGPGSYFTHDLSGVPILVTRDGAGQLRAFLNACRHRGAKVATQASGDCRRFVCPYHAWSYDLDGKLHSITEKHCFPNVDRDRTGLIALPSAERHGMIFVVPSPGMELDIDSYLGKFGQDLASFGLEQYTVSALKNVPGQIDWKLMVEANQESYHINFLHGRSAGRRYRDQCSLVDLDAPHSRSVLVHAGTGRTSAPGEAGRASLLDHADLVYFIFPNTLALFAGNGVQVISPFPQGLGRSIMQGARLDPPGATARAAKEYAAAFYGNYWQTILEDIRVSETIQSGAAAPTDLPLWLGSNEITIAEFHRHIEAALAGEPTAQTYPTRLQPEVSHARSPSLGTAMTEAP